MCKAAEDEEEAVAFLAAAAERLACREPALSDEPSELLDRFAWHSAEEWMPDERADRIGVVHRAPAREEPIGATESASARRSGLPDASVGSSRQISIA